MNTDSLDDVQQQVGWSPDKFNMKLFLSVQKAAGKNVIACRSSLHIARYEAICNGSYG